MKILKYIISAVLFLFILFVIGIHILDKELLSKNRDLWYQTNLPVEFLNGRVESVSRRDTAICETFIEIRVDSIVDGYDIPSNYLVCKCEDLSYIQTNDQAIKLKNDSMLTIITSTGKRVSLRIRYGCDE